VTRSMPITVAGLLLASSARTPKLHKDTAITAASLCYSFDTMAIEFDQRKRTHRLSTIRAALEQPSCSTTMRMRRPKHSQLGQDLRSQVTRWKLGSTLQARASDDSENCTCGEHHSKFAFTTSSLRVASSTFGCIDRPKPMRLQQPP